MNSMVIPRLLQYLIVICASVLLFTWGLPHTIALRNTMLVIGALASLYILIKHKPFVLDWNATPLILIYCLPVWVLIHYCFFAQELDLQWLEIKSLWIRVFAGMLIATAMSALIRKSDSVNNLFIFAFFGMSISIISLYILRSWQLGHILAPQEFLANYLFGRNKIGAAFFGAIDLAVSCAFLHFLINAKFTKNYFAKSIIVVLMMAVSIGASIVADSKNGVGIATILISIFLINLLFLSVFNKEIKKCIFGLSLIALIVILLLSALAIHKKNTSYGWASLIPDIQTSIQIDEHKAWRGPAASYGEPYPKNGLGQDVAGSTYERYSWITAGLREIKKHPMGYGLINHQAFPRWLKADGISFDHQGSTHSGWVDLGLSFGLPAMLIVFSSFAMIFVLTIKNIDNYLFLYLAGWISLAIFLAGFVQEITYQHTFEAMIFLIAFSGGCCATGWEIDS